MSLCVRIAQIRGVQFRLRLRFRPARKLPFTFFASVSSNTPVTHLPQPNPLADAPPSTGCLATSTAGDGIFAHDAVHENWAMHIDGLDTSAGLCLLPRRAVSLSRLARLTGTSRFFCRRRRMQLRGRVRPQRDRAACCRHVPHIAAARLPPGIRRN